MSIKTPNTKINLINNRIKYGTDGGINVDSNALFVNATTGRVGINTTNPISLLDISGNIKSSSITDYSNSTGNNTQILTNVNREELWSYPGYNFNGGDMFPEIQVDLSAILVENTTVYKYVGGALAPNGKIYCAPFSVNDVGIIDPITNTLDRTTISGITGGGKYIGAVLANNGKIYLIPFNAQNVAIVDPNTNTIDLTTISSVVYSDLSAANKFHGGVLGADGKIYCYPRGVSYIGVIDPATNTFSKINYPVGESGEYYTGALGRNGNIYFCPWAASKFLRLRPSDNSLNFFGSVDNFNALGQQYSGSCCGPDGNIYFGGNKIGNMVRIDVSSETASIITRFLPNGNLDMTDGLVLGLDGKIYCVPSSTQGAAVNRIFFYDTIRDTSGSIAINFPNNIEKFYGGVVAPNGKIYLIPAQYSHVATIKTGVPRLQPWMMAPEFNKL